MDKQDAKKIFDGADDETLAQYRSLIDAGKVKLLVSGYEIIFRIPDMEDFIAIDEAYPLLPGMEAFDEALDAGSKDRETLEAELAKHFEDPAKQKRFVDRTKNLLVLCSMSPKLTLDFPLEPKEGTLPVRALKDQDRSGAFVILQALSDFNAEAAVELRPFSDGSSHSPSTQSQSDTGDSPRKS